MRNKIFKLLLVLVAILVIAGCAKNPSGNFGPSWDVAYQVPLVENEVETAENLLSGNEDVIIPDGTQEDDRIKFESDFSDTNFPTVDLGNELANVDLPSQSQPYQLDPLELTAPTSIDIAYSGVPVTDSSPVTKTTTLQVSEFDIATFTDSTTTQLNDLSSVNNLNINVDASNLTSGDVGFVIDFAYQDTSNTSQTDTLEFTVSNGDGNLTPASSWNLNGQDIDFSQGIDITIEVAGKNSSSGDIDFLLGFSNLEVAKVVNLEAGEIEDQTFKPDLLDFGTIESGVKEVDFTEGKLYTKFTPYADSGLSFTVSSFGINNLTDDDSDGVIDLTSATLSDLSRGLDIKFTLDVSTTDTTVTYDTTQDITIEGGFSDGTTYTKASIDSVTLDSSYLSNNDLSTSFDQQVLSDVSEYFSKLTVNDAVIDLTINHGISNLKLALDTVSFQALASNGAIVSSKSLADLDQDGTATITGTDGTISLNAGELFTWLGTLDDNLVSEVVLKGSVSSGLVDDTQDVTISSSSNIESGMQATIAFDFTLENDIEKRMTPSLVSDSLDKDQVDDLEEVIKETRLVISELNNQFPIGINVDVYVANMDDWAGYSDQQLEDLSETELDKLYQADNLFKSISIEGNTNKKEEVLLEPEEGHRFTADNVYVGVRYTIPAGDLVLNSTDKIELKNAFVKLVTKVNQGGDQ
jgi:hypothetical protein